MGNRIFVYEGKKFPDPDPSKTADEVRGIMANFYPELYNADVKEGRDGEDTVFEFVKRVGSKGAKTRVYKARICKQQDSNKLMLEKALEIEAACGGDDDCEQCQLNVLARIDVSPTGVDQVGPLCSWIQMVRALVENKDNWM